VGLSEVEAIEEMHIKLAELEQQLSSAQQRIEGLERGQEAITRLATAVEVLTVKQDDINRNVSRLSEKLDTLEQRPARRWDSLLDKILLLLAGAFVTFLLSQGGV
jgi:predicted  nucleic acid-binding Zn-ribbon protein